MPLCVRIILAQWAWFGFFSTPEVVREVCHSGFILEDCPSLSQTELSVLEIILHVQLHIEQIIHFGVTRLAFV